MKIRTYTVVVLMAFAVVAVFGLYMPTLGHEGHVVSCPFVPGGTALCGALVHLEHWQSAFLAVCAEAFALLALSSVFLSRYGFFDPDIGRRGAYRALNRSPVPPPLFQELFSAGILNRKEPYQS